MDFFVLMLKRLIGMNFPRATEPESLISIQKRVTRFVIKAGLFWNNGPIVQSYVLEDGIFYWHASMSAGEKFFQFLESVGILLRDGRRGYRLAIRLDAVDLYSDYLVERGLAIESVIDALVCVGGESWLETSREPFSAKFYDKLDGTADFDCRQLMLDLVSLGYADQDGALYVWTPKMHPILKANYF